jgi:hypothetical protein
LLALAAVAFYASAFLIWIQNSTVVAPQMDSYAVIDARVISVRAYVAPCSWTRVASVTESTAAIRVAIETLPCPMLGAGSDALSVRELTVTLSDDLGMRTVEDADGEAIPLR